MLVKVTGYRLLVVIVTLAFVLSKGVVEYKGRSLVSTTLDWIMGVVLGIALLWLGLYQSVDPPIWPLFFHRDYSGPVFSVIQTVWRDGIPFSTFHSGSIIIGSRPLASSKLGSQHETVSTRRCISSSAERLSSPRAPEETTPVLYPSKAGLGLTYSYETVDPGSELSGTQGFSVMGSLKSEHFKNSGKGRQLQ
jgi:hypothetical protein